MRQFKITKSITTRSEESLDKYLVEISRMPMISPDQEVELAQIIKKGGKKGEEAKEKLVTSNLRFVISVAKQYQHQGVPLIDLINEGNLGSSLLPKSLTRHVVLNSSPMPSGGFVRVSFRLLLITAVSYADPKARLPSATKSRTLLMHSFRSISVIRLRKN